MTLATLGWGFWWLAVILASRFPETAPSMDLTQVVSSTFAVAGIMIGLFTLRAKLAWILICFVPLGANVNLLVMPFLVQDLAMLAP